MSMHQINSGCLSLAWLAKPKCAGLQTVLIGVFVVALDLRPHDKMLVFLGNMVSVFSNSLLELLKRFFVNLGVVRQLFIKLINFGCYFLKYCVKYCDGRGVFSFIISFIFPRHISQLLDVSDFVKGVHNEARSLRGQHSQPINRRFENGHFLVLQTTGKIFGCIFKVTAWFKNAAHREINRQSNQIRAQISELGKQLACKLLSPLAHLSRLLFKDCGLLSCFQFFVKVMFDNCSAKEAKECAETGDPYPRVRPVRACFLCDCSIGRKRSVERYKHNYRELFHTAYSARAGVVAQDASWRRQSLLEAA